MGGCSPCMSPVFRAIFAGILQLVLGLALMALHLLCEMKYINDAQIYGPYFRSITARQSDHETTYQTYHVFSFILAVAMVFSTIIFFCGMCKGRASCICAWIIMNWGLVACYTFMLLYSWRLWIIGFVIENFLVLAVTINFICCVTPLHKDFKETNR